MGGPLAGTCLVIDDAVDEILVGSDPDCRLSLDLPGVSPIHARVWRDLGGMTVYDTRSPRACTSTTRGSWTRPRSTTATSCGWARPAIPTA